MKISSLGCLRNPGNTIPGVGKTESFFNMWKNIKAQVTPPPEEKKPEIDWLEEVERAKRETKIKTRVANAIPFSEIWRSVRVSNTTDSPENYITT